MTPARDYGHDYGHDAQRAAEAHLDACLEALDAENEGQDVESPAIGMFCGCHTCCIREVLFAAWPHLYEAFRTGARP